jgi:hypothetical protein
LVLKNINVLQCRLLDPQLPEKLKKGNSQTKQTQAHAEERAITGMHKKQAQL